MSKPKLLKRGTQPGTTGATPQGADRFDFELEFSGHPRVPPVRLEATEPMPVLYLRFVQSLLDAGENYPAWLGTNAPVHGRLHLSTIVAQNTPTNWYQELDSWLKAAAGEAIRSPDQLQQVVGTPQGLAITARFTPATVEIPLAPPEKIGHAAAVPSNEDQLIKLLQAIALQSPPAFVDQMATIAGLAHQFRQTAATLLEGPLNAHLAQMPQTTAREKQDLARWVNAQLRELGLALRCPKTGRPSVLISDVKEGGSDIGRFRFENRDENGAKVRTVTLQELPELQLMEDLPRVEPLVEWSQSIRKKQTRKRS